MKNYIVNILNFIKCGKQDIDNGGNELVDLMGVACCNFTTWVQDNYSTNDKEGSLKPLPKGKWRKDFTDEIFDIKDIFKIYLERNKINL
jgi:hypothetical protein